MVMPTQPNSNLNLRQEMLSIADCLRSLQAILDDLIFEKEPVADFQNLFEIYQDFQQRVNFLEKNLITFEESFASKKQIQSAA